MIPPLPRLRLATLWLTLLAGCAVPDQIPNVILDDAHYSQGHVLAFPETTDVLASGGSDGRVALWRLPDGTRVATWAAHTDSVYGLAFLQRGRLLLSAGYDGRLALWHRDGRLTRERATPSPVTTLAVAEKRGVVLTGHEDGTVRQWRLPDLVPVAEWPLHRDYVRAVAIHASSGTFAASGADRQVYVWNASQPPRTLTSPPSDARGLVFAPDGRHLLGGGWFKLFRWDVAHDTLTVLPTEHGGIIAALDLGPDGRTLASISRQLDSAVLFLDPETGATSRRFLQHDLCGVNIALSRDGRWLATTADDSSVRIWDLKPGVP
jgi:WD40 repeat protein